MSTPIASSDRQASGKATALLCGMFTTKCMVLSYKPQSAQLQSYIKSGLHFQRQFFNFGQLQNCIGQKVALTS